MKVNTALCFALIGFSLLPTYPHNNSKFSILFSRLKKLCALLVGLTGCLTLTEYLFGWNIGIDQWLIAEPADTVAKLYPGRMNPDTALSFVLLATAIGLLDTQQSRWLELSASLGLLVTNLALAVIVTYFTPQLGLVGWFGLTVMAMHTALLFTMLGINIMVRVWQQKALFWSLNNLSTLAFVCCIFMLVQIGINASRCQFWLSETNHKIALNKKIATTLEEILAEAVEAQAQTCGYVITSDVRFLQLFAVAQTNTLADLNTLSRLSPLIAELSYQQQLQQN